jgi:hypothetical protein
MIERLLKVTDGLYRGGAPSPKDVVWLKSNLGINKIVSLDEKTGNRINRICKLLHINHIMLPLDGTRASLIRLLKHNLKDLLIDGGPTFFHCLYGKDRTGLLAALFECKYLNEDPEVALEKAKKLGFGIGVAPQFIHLYEKLIRGCKPAQDINNADIVSNERSYKEDNRDSYLDESSRSSFAPYLGKQREYPQDQVYNEINDQYPTRENYKNKPITQHNQEDDVVPIVGLYNNDAGGRGFGPTENYSGFFYD